MEEWVRDPGTAGRAGEVRQLRDVLGLTPKGRQGPPLEDRRAEVVELDDKRVLPPGPNGEVESP